MAIGYAILNCKGIHLSGLNDRRKRPPYARIDIGWPEDLNTLLYIYKVLAKDFRQVTGEPHEYYSIEAVKPVSFEVVRLKDYIHYAKKAKDWRPEVTKKDKNWMACRL